MEQWEIAALLNYDPETGIFRWRSRTSPRAGEGEAAGCVDPTTGYRRIRLHGKSYAAHRLAWVIVFGVWPDTIDHRDGERDNNRLSNLREVSASENQQNIGGPKINNSTGVLGVTYNKKARKFHSTIRANGRQVFLGQHDTAERAGAAYLAAKAKYHTHGDRLL